MSSVASFLAELGPWAWFVAGLALFALETIIPGLHFIWYGVAALLVGFLSVATGIDWQLQLVAFGLISVLTVLLVRRYSATAGTEGEAEALHSRSQEYVGRVVMVEDAIVAGRGKVRVGDSVWIAEGNDMPKGTRARVVSSRGTVLVVERDRG